MKVFEGLIKVPVESRNTIIEAIKGIIKGRFKYYHDEIIKEHPIDSEEYEMFYEDDGELFKYFKTFDSEYVIDYKENDILFEYGISENIKGYPKLPEKVKLIVRLEFNNNKRSAYYTKVSDNGEEKYLIHLDFTEHYENLGKSPNGEEVWSANVNNIKADYKECEHMFHHELMHLVQDNYLKKGNFKVDYLDKDDRIDYDKYFTSEIEFSPMLHSKIQRFLLSSEGKDKKEILKNFKEYVSLNSGNNSDIFFIKLKQNKPSMYKKALKIFLSEIEELLK